jgi:hypothetical protein
MIKKVLTPLAAALCLLSTNSFAVEYQSPRTLGLGGAGRGAPLLTDAIYLNPAYSSFINSYSLHAGYLWFEEGRSYNVSIQDSRTEMFQAGMGFTRREQNAVINIGASKTVVEQLGFGLGSKIVLDDQGGAKTTDFLFSTTFLATHWVYTSLIIDNLLETDAGRERNLYRNFYLGLKFFAMKELLIYVDPIYSPSYPYGNKAGFSAGAEFAMMADFFLRVGKFVDAEVAYLNTRGDGWGIGVGWLGPKINFEYALHRVTSDHAQHRNHSAHTASITVFF